MRHRTIPTLFVMLLFVSAACGDDADNTNGTDDNGSVASVAITTAADATTVAATAPATELTVPETTVAAEPSVDPAVTEFCTAVEEINNSAAAPTVEQIEAYGAVAPEELQAPVQILIDTLEAADGDFTAVFADETAGAALEEITAVEAAVCGTGDEGPPQDPMVTVIDEQATRVDLIANEYAYEGELPTAAGRYSFVMTNEGQEPHIMILIRLEDGVALDQALASEGDEGVAEEFESTPAGPGGEGVLTADLGPGNWVLLCPIPGPEGHPHFVDGMIEEFTIT